MSYGWKWKCYFLYLYFPSLLFKTFFSIPLSQQQFSGFESPSQPWKELNGVSGSQPRSEEPSCPSLDLKNIFVPLETIKSSTFAEPGSTDCTDKQQDLLCLFLSGRPVLRSSRAHRSVWSWRDPCLPPLCQRLPAESSRCCRARRLHGEHIRPRCERLRVRGRRPEGEASFFGLRFYCLTG